MQPSLPRYVMLETDKDNILVPERQAGSRPSKGNCRTTGPANANNNVHRENSDVRKRAWSPLPGIHPEVVGIVAYHGSILGSGQQFFDGSVYWHLSR